MVRKLQRNSIKKGSQSLESTQCDVSELQLFQSDQIAENVHAIVKPSVEDSSRTKLPTCLVFGLVLLPEESCTASKVADQVKQLLESSAFPHVKGLKKIGDDEALLNGRLLTEPESLNLSSPDSDNDDVRSVTSFPSRSVPVDQSAENSTAKHMRPVGPSKHTRSAAASIPRILKSPTSRFGRSPSSDADVEQSTITCRPMSSFRISDEEKVKAYINEKMQLLQQQGVKRIAKAWVKGICPKKQARWPYKDKRRELQGEHLPAPGWWASEQCAYKEPDHVSKNEERMALCLHLVRLRPSPQQLNDWNRPRNSTLGDQTLAFQGWTAFLKQLAPLSILDGLAMESEPSWKVELRRKCLQDIYDIAELEESYMNDECDDELVQWVPRGKPAGGKRLKNPSRLPEVEQRRKRVNTGPQPTTSAPHSPVLHHMSRITISKKADFSSKDTKPRTTAVRTLGLSNSAQESTLKGKSGVSEAARTNQRPCGRRAYETVFSAQPEYASNVAGPCSPPSEPHSGQYESDNSHGSLPTSPVQSAPSSRPAQDTSVASYGQEPVSSFSGTMDFKPPYYSQGSSAVQVHCVTGIPQPCFDPVPDGLMLSTMNLAPPYLTPNLSPSDDHLMTNYWGLPLVEHKTTSGSWNPHAPMPFPMQHGGSEAPALGQPFAYNPNSGSLQSRAIPTPFQKQVLGAPLQASALPNGVEHSFIGLEGTFHGGAWA